MIQMWNRLCCHWNNFRSNRGWTVGKTKAQGFWSTSKNNCDVEGNGKLSDIISRINSMQLRVRVSFTDLPHVFPFAPSLDVISKSALQQVQNTCSQHWKYVAQGVATHVAKREAQSEMSLYCAHGGQFIIAALHCKFIAVHTTHIKVVHRQI